MERTGYSLEVTIGQRKYGGPPPGYEGPVPSGGCEVSIVASGKKWTVNGSVIDL